MVFVQGLVAVKPQSIFQMDLSENSVTSNVAFYHRLYPIISHYMLSY